jgi:dipeptide/tripeptide permease
MKTTKKGGFQEYYYSIPSIKINNQIDWSWWWVTSPLWIGHSLIALFILLVIVIYIILKYVNIPLKSKSILSPIDLRLNQILESITK